MLDDLKATVACEDKKGGGVYDLKITAKLNYNILYDAYTDDKTRITYVNPSTPPKPKTEESNSSDSSV